MAFIADSVTSNGSQPVATGKQVASTFLLPFSGEIRIDTELILSHGDFKQSIATFYSGEKLSVLKQLEETPPYPTPHVLAQFASMAYRDCKHRDPKPPEGWQLLTTASHFGIKNGYFGTAYWHPEHQQVVIAHRGTASIGAVVTDIKGVLFNNYVEQMSSASTFANKVVTVLQEIEQKGKAIFELFFTGHSLGGWLAQITNFTTEYLEEKGGTFHKKLKTQQEEKQTSSTVQENHDFQKVGMKPNNPFDLQYIKDNAGKFLTKREERQTPTSNNVQDTHDIRQSYHPHTVVFDSPGCETMLLQMKRTFDVRHKGSSINLQHLDITSYLSAPNRINTCNPHLGTVYRIFTDLSDMGWNEKHTPLYNVATHSMDKIVQAFDPETGQVCKDNKDEPKIREVVDWPISVGLMGGAEYKNFFNVTQHHNNYHPEVLDTVPLEVRRAYHPYRYQTKVYDECTKSLSVFNQDERDFLESYRWLRHVPEFFKPEGLFCVMSNAKAEKEAKQKLRKFELDCESIRCPDASTLHGLISYVKRLLRLFPQLKERVKDQLSSHNIRNMVYQYETQRYVEKITQSALDFNPGALELKEFLTGDQQIWQLRMIDGDAWRGIIKVYRVLQRTSSTSNYSREGQYTILDLERLSIVNRIMNLNPLLAAMENPHLLMIVCETNQLVNEELRDIFKKLFSILINKKEMKIIVTTQSEGNTAKIIEQIAREAHGEGFIAIYDQSIWSDLTASSQCKILEKTVIFQGRRVSLNKLTSDKSMTDSFPLADLLQETELRIGEEPVPSAGSGYDEKYYIDRTFNHNVVIRQDFAFDNREGKFGELFASTELEFKQLCEQNPTCNVHWLVQDKAGEIVWQQSQGNLRKLYEYIDVQKSHSYASSEFDRLLQQEKKQTVMLIADKAGMGKTTVLTHMSKLIKQKNPASWLVRIDLNEYGNVFKAQKGKKVDKGRVLEFVSKEVLKLESRLEKELFEKSFEGNGVNKLVVMVDGFDEISPSYKVTVIDMLQVLKQTSLDQLWVTTRSHLKEELEDNLHQLSYTLEPFSEFEQVEFLKKFWLQTLNLEDTNQHRSNNYAKTLIYAKALIRKLAQSISDKDKEFTGIPLQTHMLAEAFEENFKSFYISEKSEPELPQKLDLLGLYRRFVGSRYDIFYREKAKTPADNVNAERIRDRDLKNMQMEHWRLALVALFTEDQLTLLPIYNLPKLPDEDLARIGIVQRNNEGKLQFIHRTIAEYFVADFIVNELTKKTKQHAQVQEILLNKVLFEKDSYVIRTFLDGLLENSKPSKEVLKEYGEKLDEQQEERGEYGTLKHVTKVLHTAAKEDNPHIIEFLLDSLKLGGSLSTLKNLFLAKDSQEQTAWHKAAENDSVQAFKKIWELAEAVTTWQEGAERSHSKTSDTTRASVEEEELRPNQLKKKLFLAKDQYGNTAWHGAAQSGSLKALKTLWNWAKEVELNLNELLLAQNEEGNTAWQLAAQTGHFKLLQKLEVWAMEAQLNSNELKDKLLLAKDQYEYTVWHRAAEGGSLAALETLWILVKKSELKPDEIFLAQGKDGNTAWQIAAQRGHFKVLKKLWEWANEEQMDGNVLKERLLLARKQYGYSAWHRTAERGSLKALETGRSWAKEAEPNQDELKKTLFLTQDKQGETTWHLAAEKHPFEVLEKLWAWAKEAQKNPDDLKKALLLAKDQYGYTVWHRAAQRGSLEELETLWSWVNPDEFFRQN